MKKVLSTLLALTFAFSCCAIFAAKSSKATVSLHANPSTGYCWVYSVDKEGMIKETSHSYSHAATFTGVPIVGAGGVEEWQFEGLKEGDITIQFAYERPWAKDKMGPEVKTFKYHIDKNLNMQLISEK